MYIELTVKPENKELYNTNYENLAQISYQEIINQDTNIRKYLEELEIEDLENISINLARVQIIQPSGTDYIKYFEENIENINKKKLYLNDFSKKIYYFALSFIEILNKNIYDDSKVNDEELMKQFITILIATRGKDVMVQNKQLAESNKFLREYLQKIISESNIFNDINSISEYFLRAPQILQVIVPLTQEFKIPLNKTEITNIFEFTKLQTEQNTIEDYITEIFNPDKGNIMALSLDIVDEPTLSLNNFYQRFYISIILSSLFYIIINSKKVY